MEMAMTYPDNTRLYDKHHHHHCESQFPLSSPEPSSASASSSSSLSMSSQSMGHGPENNNSRKRHLKKLLRLLCGAHRHKEKLWVSIKYISVMYSITFAMFIILIIFRYTRPESSTGSPVTAQQSVSNSSAGGNSPMSIIGPIISPASDTATTIVQLIWALAPIIAAVSTCFPRKKRDVSVPAPDEHMFEPLSSPSTVDSNDAGSVDGEHNHYHHREEVDICSVEWRPLLRVHYRFHTHDGLPFETTSPNTSQPGTPRENSLSPYPTRNIEASSPLYSLHERGDVSQSDKESLIGPDHTPQSLPSRSPSPELLQDEKKAQPASAVRWITRPSTISVDRRESIRRRLIPPLLFPRFPNLKCFAGFTHHTHHYLIIVWWIFMAVFIPSMTALSQYFASVALLAVGWYTSAFVDHLKLGFGMSPSSSMSPAALIISGFIYTLFFGWFWDLFPLSSADWGQGGSFSGASWFILATIEEIGWAGVLFPSLLNATHGNLFRSAFWTGFIWSSWHWLAIWFGYAGIIPHSTAYVPGIEDTPIVYGFLMFFLSTLSARVIICHITMRSGTIWTACMFHAAHNAMVFSFFAQLPDWQLEGENKLLLEPLAPYIIGESGLVLNVVYGCTALYFLYHWATTFAHPGDVENCRKFHGMTPLSTPVNGTPRRIKPSNQTEASASVGGSSSGSFLAPMYIASDDDRYHAQDTASQMD